MQFDSRLLPNLMNKSEVESGINAEVIPNSDFNGLDNSLLDLN